MMRIWIPITICFTAVALISGNAAEPVAPIPTTTPEEAIRSSMHAKLKHSQDVLHGLVTSDYDRIKQAAKALKEITLAAPKTVDDDPIDNELYNHFKLEFLRLATQLELAAQKENLEGAAFAYQNITANCLACHSYLSGERPNSGE